MLIISAAATENKEPEKAVEDAVQDVKANDAAVSDEKEQKEEIQQKEDENGKKILSLNTSFHTP